MRHLLASRRGVSCPVYFVAALALIHFPLARAQKITLEPPSGPASASPVTITGKGLHFGTPVHQGTVTFEGVQAKILHWSDTAIQVAPVDAQAKMPVHLTVLVYSDKEKQIGQAGAYYETLPPLDPPSGLAGATVTINGTGFSPTGKPGTVTIGGQKQDLAPNTKWSDTTLSVVMPDAGAHAMSVGLKVVVTDSSSGTHDMGEFVEMPHPAPASPISPASAHAGDKVTITGKGFGLPQTANSKVTFNGLKADLAPGTFWTNTSLTVIAPDAGAHAANTDLKVVVTDSNGTQQEIGEFEEIPPATPGTLKLTPDSGFGGTALKITGTGFGAVQGAQTLLFNGAPLAVLPANWKDTEIDVTLPAFAAMPDTPVEVAIQDNGKTTFDASFKELAATAVLNHDTGVSGDTVTISGIPDLTKDNKATVTFKGITATVQPKSSSDSTPNWTPTTVTVAAPDLHVPHDDKGIPLPVTVVNGDGNTVAKTSVDFTEKREIWGDMDENPLDIKMVVGYEQGYLSSQGSNNNAFLAIYGRKLFGAKKSVPTFGPYFAIRLLTAPQTNDNYNVTSVFTNPTGQIQASDFSTIGSAVDLSLGLEWQFARLSRGRTTLSAIFGGGFITPTNANTVGQSYTMPGYGTVECTELQDRLIGAGILNMQGKGNGYYTNISTGAVGQNSCFVNTAVPGTASGDSTLSYTPIALLNYAAPDSLSFYPKYGGGFRIVNRWPELAGGPKHCTDANHCERGYVDFTMGQNNSITGGVRQHAVLTVDSTYPMPVPNLNYLYLFGTFSKRVGNLPKPYPPLILQPGTAGTVSGTTPPTAPDASILVIPLAQPDRDFYRIGVGVDITKVFTALTGQSKSQ